MSIPSREATQPPGRCKLKTGQLFKERICSLQSKFLATEQHPCLNSHPVKENNRKSHKYIAFIRRSSAITIFAPLRPRTKSNMSPRGENRGPTDHEPTAPRKSCKYSAFYLYVYHRRVSRRCLDNVDPTFRNAIDV